MVRLFSKMFFSKSKCCCTYEEFSDYCYGPKGYVNMFYGLLVCLSLSLAILCAAASYAMLRVQIGLEGHVGDKFFNGLGTAILIAVGTGLTCACATVLSYCCLFLNAALICPPTGSAKIIREKPSKLPKEFYNKSYQSEIDRVRREANIGERDTDTLLETHPEEDSSNYCDCCCCSCLNS